MRQSDSKSQHRTAKRHVSDQHEQYEPYKLARFQCHFLENFVLESEWGLLLQRRTFQFFRHQAYNSVLTTK